MSELNEFLKVLAEGKKQKEQEIQESKKELGDFLSVVAEAKAQDPKHQMLKEVKKHVQQDIADLFGQLTQAKPVAIVKIDELVEAVELIEEIEPVQEQVIPVGVPETKPAAEIHSQAEIDKYLRRNASFQQPDPNKAEPNIRALQDKLKFLEQAVGRIAATGPGSGEVNFRWLDDVDRESISAGRFLTYNPITKLFTFDEINTQEVVYNTTIVTTATYEVQPGDYYVGVDYNGPCTIVLPATATSGRTIIIKDEDGDAELNPITVEGTVDNDAGGFIIQINNGAIQLIYRNGWRII